MVVGVGGRIRLFGVGIGVIQLGTESDSGNVLRFHRREKSLLWWIEWSFWSGGLRLRSVRHVGVGVGVTFASGGGGWRVVIGGEWRRRG